MVTFYKSLISSEVRYQISVFLAFPRKNFLNLNVWYPKKAAVDGSDTSHVILNLYIYIYIYIYSLGYIGYRWMVINGIFYAYLILMY